MFSDSQKQLIAKRLQAQINALQGLGKPSCDSATGDFEPFASAFPNRIFPKNAVHEFISYEPAEAASTNGFITALTGKLIQNSGLCLWIGNTNVFAPALQYFGLQPDRVVFIAVQKHKEALWVIEEALKCEALTAVVAEIRELSFTESRRLQLAVERSAVTSFVHRHRPFAENAVACTTRWKIVPGISISDDGLPGIGHYCWNVELLKVRNSKPHSWQVGWRDNTFVPVDQKQISVESTQTRHVG